MREVCYKCGQTFKAGNHLGLPKQRTAGGNKKKQHSYQSAVMIAVNLDESVQLTGFCDNCGSDVGPLGETHYKFGVECGEYV